MKNKRKWIIRGAVVLCVLALAAVLMYVGRGHTVYFDNKTLEYGGETYSAFQRVEVYVGGERVAKLSKRDRGMATCIGQNFSMTLEITPNKGDDPVTKTYSLALPYNLDGIVVNLPGLLADLPQDAWMTEFVSLATTSTPEDEEIITEDDGLGDF